MARIKLVLGERVGVNSYSSEWQLDLHMQERAIAEAREVLKANRTHMEDEEEEQCDDNRSTGTDSTSNTQSIAQ